MQFPLPSEWLLHWKHLGVGGGLEDLSFSPDLKPLISFVIDQNHHLVLYLIVSVNVLLALYLIAIAFYLLHCETPESFGVVWRLNRIN